MLPLIYSRDNSMNPMPYNTIACETEYCVRQNIRSVKEEFPKNRRVKIPYPCEIDPIQAYKDLLAQQKDMETSCQNYNNIITVKNQKLPTPSVAPFTWENKAPQTNSISQHESFTKYETSGRQNRQYITDDINIAYENEGVVPYHIHSSKDSNSVYVTDQNKNNAEVNGRSLFEKRVPSMNEGHYGEDNQSSCAYLNNMPYDDGRADLDLKNIKQPPVQMEKQHVNKRTMNNIDYKCLCPLEREHILYKIHSPMQREYSANRVAHPLKEYLSVLEENTTARPVEKCNEQSQIHENHIKQGNGKRVTIIEKPTHVFHFNPQKSSGDDNKDVESDHVSQEFDASKRGVMSPGVFENIATFARVLVDVTKTKVIKAFGPSEQNPSGVPHGEKSNKALKQNSNKLRVYSKYPYGKIRQPTNGSNINSNYTPGVRKSCLKNAKAESQQTQISNKFFETNSGNQNNKAPRDVYYTNTNQQATEHHSYRQPAPFHCHNAPKQNYMSVNQNITNAINNASGNLSSMDYNTSSIENNATHSFPSDELSKFDMREPFTSRSPSQPKIYDTACNSFRGTNEYGSVSISNNQYSLLNENHISQKFTSGKNNKENLQHDIYNRQFSQLTTDRPKDNFNVIEDKSLSHNGFIVSTENQRQDRTKFSERLNNNSESVNYLVSSKKHIGKKENAMLRSNSLELHQNSQNTDFTLPRSPLKNSDITKSLTPCIDPKLRVLSNAKNDSIQKKLLAETPKLKPIGNISSSSVRMLKHSLEKKSYLKYRNNDMKNIRTKAEHTFYKNCTSRIKSQNINPKVNSVPKRSPSNTLKSCDPSQAIDSSIVMRRTVAVYPFSQGNKNTNFNKAQHPKNLMSIGNSINEINKKITSPSRESHELTKRNVTNTCTTRRFNESKKSNLLCFSTDSKIISNNSTKIKNNGSIDNLNTSLSVHDGFNQESIKRHCSTTSLEVPENVSTSKKFPIVCTSNYIDSKTSTDTQGGVKLVNGLDDVHKNNKSHCDDNRKNTNKNISSLNLGASHRTKPTLSSGTCVNSYPTTSCSTLTQNNYKSKISNNNKESFNDSLTKQSTKSNSFKATRSPILKKKTINKNATHAKESISTNDSVEDHCPLCENPTSTEIGPLDENRFSLKVTTPKKLLPYIACSPNNKCTRSSFQQIRKLEKFNDTTVSPDITWNTLQTEKVAATSSSCLKQIHHAYPENQNNSGDELKNHSNQIKIKVPINSDRNLENIITTARVLTPSSLSMTGHIPLINRHKNNNQHKQWVETDDIISHENCAAWNDEQLDDYKEFCNETERKCSIRSPSSTQKPLVTLNRTPADYTENFSNSPSRLPGDILTNGKTQEMQLRTSQGTGKDYQIPTRICISGSMLSPHDRLTSKPNILSRDERMEKILINVKKLVEEAKELKMPEVADLLEQLDVAVTTLKTKTYVHDASEYAKYALNAIKQVQKPLNSFSSSESMTCTTLPSDTWMYSDQSQSFHPLARLYGKKTALQRFLETGEIQLNNLQLNTSSNTINKTNPFTSTIPPLVNNNFFFETGKNIVHNRKKDRSFIKPIVSTSMCQFFLDKFANESIPIDNVKLLSKTLEAIPIKLALNESRFPYAVIQDTPVAMVCLGVLESKIVALQVPKVKDPETTQTDLLYKFLHEWDILRHCDHPNILKFLGGIRVSQDQVWLVMDRLEGIDYRTIQLSKNNQFTLRQRVTMCFQLATVLEYLHTPNNITGKKIVVHRNISTENLLINSEDMSIRLCGFTYAQESSTDEVECIDDASWLYAAPEFLYRTALDTDTIELSDIPQWNIFAEQPITSKLDIWSAGCVFQEILCGPNPLQHITGEEALSSRIFLRLSIALTSDTFIPQIYSHVPFQCQELIASCFQMDPRKRPSASKVVQRWKNILSSLVDHQ